MSRTLLLDALFAEIGSTKTMVTAYTGLDDRRPRLEGQGVSATTVEEGDIRIGLERAISDLKRRLGDARLKWRTMMATCSAAGGLRMSVHGLVEAMTSRAAREAALGAGAILVSESFGLLTGEKLNHIMALRPRIVLLAGGVEGGASETVLENARRLAATCGPFSVVFAGNTHLRSAVTEIFSASKVRLFMAENVYPTIDMLNITPAREIIHEIFEEQLTECPGMEGIKGMVDGPVLPTPGAVMLASQVLAKRIGDLITVDVGGATTDIHSVTHGSPEIREIQLDPEPWAKRTVEGDLGIYVNAANVYQTLVRKDAPMRQRGPDIPSPLPLFPVSRDETHFCHILTEAALGIALERHAGRIKGMLTYQGEKRVAEGRDLTTVEHVVGTGGALTRLGRGLEILHKTFNEKEMPGRLVPKRNVRCLLDQDYIMAGAGLMALGSRQLALRMMEGSLGIGPGANRGSDARSHMSPENMLDK